MRDTKIHAFRALVLKPIFIALDEKCVNRTKLAKKCGITKTLLYQYETGRLQVPGDVIDRMIAALQLDPNIIPPDARALVERKQSATKGA
jgi:hypothetical protein